MILRLVKWIAVFAVAFAAAWIVIFTFTQEAFTTTASAKIFSYRTPQIPVFWYVGGSFALGLGLGLLLAAAVSIAAGMELRRQRKRIRDLETDLDDLRLTALPAAASITASTPSPAGAAVAPTISPPGEG